jgi:hypothetical protein
MKDNDLKLLHEIRDTVVQLQRLVLKLTDAGVPTRLDELLARPEVRAHYAEVLTNQTGRPYTEDHE